MNPAKTNDQSIKINRWQAFQSAGFLINNKFGGAFTGFAIFCACITPLSAAKPLSSSVQKDDGLDDRAEVYVDRFFPPNPRLSLLGAGQLRADALAHYSRALAFEKEKNFDAALKAYSEVLRLTPANVVLARKVAYLQASGGRLKEAREILEKSLQLNPLVAQAYLSYSEFLLTYYADSAEDRKKAMLLAEDAEQKFADDAVVYDHLIRLYLVSRQTDKAKAAIDRALKQESAEPDFWLKIAMIAQRVWPLTTSAGQKPILLNGIYQKVLDHSKDQVEPQVAVAGFYSSSHQAQKARELYEEIILEHPERLDLRKKLASVYQVLGQQEKVIEILRDVVQIDPRDAQTNRLLAEVYRARKDPVNAAHFLQQALKISKGSESEYMDLAQLLLSARKPEEAVPVLERAAYYYPEEPFVAFLLAVARSRAEQYEDSLSAFERAILLGKETRPGLLNEQFYFQYGAAAERAGKLEQAATLFRKSMSILAKSGAEDEESKAFAAQLYNYLGYMWLENDMHIDEAGELIKTAFDLTPESGAIRDSLGWFYFKKKRFKEARLELNKAMELMQEPDPTVFDHLARTYFQLGMKEEALQHMRKALDLDSANKEFVDRLRKFETQEPPVSQTIPKPSNPVKKKPLPPAVDKEKGEKAA
ncbi:MAG: tetratricopeptide repeat protein [Verrucomicrobiota bacterium]